MTIKLYDGAKVTLCNGDRGVCRLGVALTTTYPYDVCLDDGRKYCGYSLSGRFGIGVGTQFDVVSIEEPEPEFKDGDKVEVGYEISDVWNPYTYALKFNGQHYVYGVRDTLIIAQKVRKPEPKYKYRWLMQNPETLDIWLSSFYETGAEAEAANGAVKALYPIKESKIPI